MDDFPLLSAITYLPLVGALVIFFIPNVTAGDDADGRARGVPRRASRSRVVLLFGFDHNAEFQFNENVEWLPDLGVTYRMGVDGIAVLLIALTTLLSTIAIIWSWDTVNTRTREYYIAMLLLETGMLGVFMALDLFIFYIFWELMLIPMALLIGIWGSTNRVYAAIKFFLYTLFGSLLMLVGDRRDLPGLLQRDRHPHPQRPGTAERRPTAATSSSGSSPPSSSPSRSRCRCSRSTPGCRTPTSRRRPRPRSSWPRSC